MLPQAAHAHTEPFNSRDPMNAQPIEALIEKLKALPPELTEAEIDAEIAADRARYP